MPGNWEILICHVWTFPMNFRQRMEGAGTGSTGTECTCLMVSQFLPSRLVRFWELSPKGVFVALPLAVILTILFFFDHNVSSLLSQKREFHLKKPPAYHWDFFVLGIGRMFVPFSMTMIWRTDRSLTTIKWWCALSLGCLLQMALSRKLHSTCIRWRPSRKHMRNTRKRIVSPSRRNVYGQTCTRTGYLLSCRAH